MANYADTDFFTDLSLIDDPYPFYEYLREAGPAVRLPAQNTVAVTRFDEALAIVLDPDNYSSVNSVTGPLPPPPFAPQGDDITGQIEANRPQMPFGEDVLTLDQPRHTPLRWLMMKLFTPRRLKEMEAEITRIADQLIDEIVAQGGSFEAIGDFTKPFATLAIAELLGVPPADRDHFRALLAQSPVPSHMNTDGPVVNPMDFRRDKFMTYVEDRRRTPQGDIITDLTESTFPDGSAPTDMDIVRVATLLFGAGQDTTSTLVGNCLRIIAEDQDIQAQLRADPALIPSFIEEVLRLAGPVKSTYRLARKPTTVGGVDIPAGTTVMVATAGVNRDPRKFEDPDEFRIGRRGAKEHLSFGRGIHTCPGAALSRTETRIALEQLLARTIDIGLDPEHHGPEGARRFDYLPSYVFRSLNELHLRFA